MVTFDVKSLFTQIPLEDALVIIKERLESDDSLEDRTTFSVQKICHLTEMCLKSTYFQYENLICKQKDGTQDGVSTLTSCCQHIYGRF